MSSKSLVKKKSNAEVSKTQAIKFLSDVNPDHSFWINNGPVINNLIYLLRVIENLNKSTFQHHVNKTKNDFSTWIENIVGDKTLAKDLQNVTTKNAFLKRLKERVNTLKQIGI